MIENDRIFYPVMLAAIIGFEWIVWRRFKHGDRPVSAAGVSPLRTRAYWTIALSPLIGLVMLSALLLVGASLSSGVWIIP